MTFTPRPSPAASTDPVVGPPGDPVERRDVVLLGSTGSIGTQALDVIARNPGRFRVVALAAGGGNLRLLAEQAAVTGAGVVAVPRADQAGALVDALDAAGAHAARVLAGPEAMAEVAALPAHTVLNGLAGAAGLGPTVAALRAGRTVALANKESLIIGGRLVTDLAAPGQLVPVDSEHSALAQCLRGGTRGEVRRLVLTASGGPFRGRTRAELDDVTPAQALAHPTWSMGPLVTINSATLVNKGLEVIEAHLLFDVPFDRIDVVVHPQSVVHSMVEFTDGSTLAQASPPDMRLPIALGLGWPDRVPDAAPGCDWSTAATWQFFPLDDAAFPAVALARAVGSAGGLLPAVYNAANEEAVAAFLAGRLRFTAVVDTVAAVVDDARDALPAVAGSLADVVEADRWARAQAVTRVERTSRSGAAALDRRGAADPRRPAGSVGTTAPDAPGAGGAGIETPEREVTR